MVTPGSIHIHLDDVIVDFGIQRMRGGPFPANALFSRLQLVRRV